MRETVILSPTPCDTGSSFRKLRLRLGITQDQFAEAAERGRASISRWERLDLPIPRYAQKLLNELEYYMRVKGYINN